MRFSGKIGLDRGDVETDPGIFVKNIEEVLVNGEIRNVGANWSNMDSAKPAARHVLSMITPEESTIDINEVVYIWWKNRKWSVVAISYKPPRVELSLGGLYNG